MNFLKKVGAIVWKDFVAEFRTKEMLGAMLIFAFLVIITFSFAFNLTRDTLKEVFSGLVWVGFIFSGLLGLNRSFFAEKSHDALMGLMLCPVDRSAIYFGKVIGNFTFMTIMELITLPLFFVFFDYKAPGSIGLFVVVILLGTIGFISIGTLLAALAVNTRSSEMILPLLLFPVIVPIILGAVSSSSLILAGEPLSSYQHWLKLMLGYDLIFLAVPYILFDFVLEV